MSFNRGNDGKPRGFGFSGFSVGNKKALENPGFSLNFGGAASRAFGHGTKIGRRRIKSEEDYFDDDDEAVNEADLEYQPAPGSPGHDGKGDSKEGGYGSDESDDPLDAFMANLEQEELGVKPSAEAEVKKGSDSAKKEKEKKGVRDDIEEEDVQEAYFRYMEENPNAGLNPEDDIDIEYDQDGNAIITEKHKIIDPLPPIDHSDIDYDPFVKNFYTEHEEIARLTYPEVLELRKKLNTRVSGLDPPKPVSSFAHMGFDEALMQGIRKMGYTQPTPIQAQGVPIALSGRDIIGIAKTGSGKTAAFLWPLLVHIMDQKELKPGDGPIGLICAPTRELSQQIYHEAKRFGKVYNIHVVCAYGGGSMWEQTKACQEGAEIIVCTPGRLIDLVKKKATNLTRVTYLVFDEADRMFDMGFEPQVRSIANHVRPDRQTLLFSATFRKRIERLARDILTDPVRVVQGDLGEANEDITQVVEVLPPGGAKWVWLTSRLVEFMSVGSVLIFVTKKANSEELATNLKARDFKVGLLHGDMSQQERNEVINQFKKKEIPTLVATDVAARGLDIPSIKTVVNFDVARDIDTHTHRIGRTGRAGEKGMAYTLVTEKDKEFAGHLVRNLEGASQEVPKKLMDLAMQANWFRKSRVRQGKGKKLNVGGQGLGFRERPGLGSGGTQTDTSTPGGSIGTSTKAPTSFSAYEPSRSAGPQSDRVAAMRAAFSAQFKSNFVSASDKDSAWIGNPEHVNSGTYQDINQEGRPEKKKRKTRWE
ncbi:ATP-dependent RNA helicase DDX42 isoform X2 [Lingula anatina]|uniref:ATP-dependent RNA helicase DDX42 n=1 Tax=Lingula anatina TaxID=7574 RepID=A0A1S3I1U1_LINAN|nr:ATP-dependent RNA helicase DDX42 isoform X2 [Lingula anatina]|eukprot:XP_013391796.1 ATP-dependent RNA helicase DDX42 isoform X2 [Lingula anatina]